MACLEAFSEEARWPAQLPERSSLPPSKAEAGTLDECPIQDSELGAHRPQYFDEGSALAAITLLKQAAPPTQVVKISRTPSPLRTRTPELKRIYMGTAQPLQRSAASRPTSSTTQRGGARGLLLWHPPRGCLVLSSFQFKTCSGPNGVFRNTSV